MSDKILERSEIDEKYKWHLNDIFESDSAWEKEYAKIPKIAVKLSGFAGKLGTASALYECLTCADELSDALLAVLAYARMRRDEDNSNAIYQGMTDCAARLMSECAAQSAFITPEILALGDARVEDMMKECSELAVYSHMLYNVFRESAHTLSEREECILAESSVISESASDIFDMFNYADIKFGDIINESGEKVELTQGRYSAFLESSDRAVRRAAFAGIYAQYGAYINTLGAALASNVKKNCFYSRVRGYKSAREMCLSEDNIPCDVYDNLIKAVDESLPSLQKYLALRQRALGLSELHMYDLYTPIVACETRKYTYEEACELVLESVAPLGDTYVKDMTRALSSGWVDVYENRGKTSGAYSWGSNGAHPFVLLNFEGTLDDVFTLAHEMGHAMHSFYTNCEQPSVYKQYKIFVAEVASTVNENLLMAHLLEITKDTKTRMYLQNHRLEGFRTTVFRQTMFAEFERDIHAQYESGVALTAEKLCDIYYKLNEKYFAENVTVDREIAYEWARIPHFYSDFYVYQYATGYSAAVTLADGILNDKKAAQRYIQFLSSGDSAYPIELLKRAGVDLTEPTAVAHALAHFSAAVEELTKYIQNS